MINYNELISGNEIVEISYKTKQKPEIVHPRVIYKDGIPNVYCKKQHISLVDFLERFANGEDGMWLAGYRRSNGRQTTITFAQHDQLTLGPLFLRIIDQIKKEPTLLKNIKDESASSVNSDFVRSKNKNRKVSLEELEGRLARQREIGKDGEDAAYRHECVRLTILGCDNPTAHIQKLSEEDVGAGYDIFSEYNGEERFIEVKSSVINNENFFLSENERVTLAELGEKAYIYLVYVDKSDTKKSKVVDEIRNPLADSRLVLEPVAYKVSVNQG